MTTRATPQHRIAVATAQMRELATAIGDVPAWSMSPAETEATLVEAIRLRAQLGELEARVAAHADRVLAGHAVAASSTAAWLAHTTRQTHAVARRTIALGRDLDQHGLVRAALAAGDLVVDQARVVVKAVEALPQNLDAEVVARAEAHLVALGAEHDARALARLGLGILEVVAPDVADAHEARVLELRERRAAARTYLRVYDDGEGCTHGQFTIPTALAGATLTKALWAFAAPKHVHATRGGGLATFRRPTSERLGEALCELIARYPVTRLPRTGALNATVVVTIDEDSLTGRTERAGFLDTGQKVSAGMARQIACEAGIIPAVLGAASVPLDLGRRQRLHSEHQRIAMQLRDRGCAAEGCDRATGLHAHHITPWATGGGTSLENGVSLCSWHHHRAHDPRYDTRYLPTGRVDFHRRT